MAADQRQRDGVTGWDGYAERWSRLHGGYDPRRASRVVGGWLRMAYLVARGLAAVGVRPSTVTVAGVVVAVGVPLSAPFGPAGPVAAALLVLLGAVADSADGALAVVSGRVSRLGGVLDSVADRLTEAAWLLALFLVGAPGWLAAGCLAVSWLHEYVRARASAVGMAELGVVTVAERPTRVLVAVLGLLAVAAGAVAGPGGPVDRAAATVTLTVWAVLGTTGLLQLAVAVRRVLRHVDAGPPAGM